MVSLEVLLGCLLVLIPSLIFGARFFFGNRPILWLSEENVFTDPKTGKTQEFPSPTNKPSVYLSLVVPAYNEEERLPIMLKETLEYLHTRQEKQKDFTYEIILVDDGSKDSTSKKALEYSKQEGSDVFRVLTLKKNRGKGGAVKRGMLCARGQYMLMVDADGATKFADIEKLESKLKSAERDGYGIAFGSRAHLEDQALAERTLLRNILMFGFHFLVSFLCVRGIRDTQCGFKLFTRKTAVRLFPIVNIERWAFDVELAYVAQSLNIPIVEVPVNWQEIPGSKLSPFAASVQMGKDLLRIRLAYMLGIWSTVN